MQLKNKLSIFLIQFKELILYLFTFSVFYVFHMKYNEKEKNSFILLKLYGKQNTFLLYFNGKIFIFGLLKCSEKNIE